VILSLSPSHCLLLLLPLVSAKTAAVLAGSPALTGDGVSGSFVCSSRVRSSGPPSPPQDGTGRGVPPASCFLRGVVGVVEPMATIPGGVAP